MFKSSTDKKSRDLIFISFSVSRTACSFNMYNFACEYAIILKIQAAFDSYYKSMISVAVVVTVAKRLLRSMRIVTFSSPIFGSRKIKNLHNAVLIE